VSATAVPARVAPVAILARDVLGAVAHRAVCQVPGCSLGPNGTPWTSRPMDALRDGSVAAGMVRSAQAHAKRHTDAQDALDARLSALGDRAAGVNQQETSRGTTDHRPQSGAGRTGEAHQ
jgi:hypothetical protein